MKNIKIPVRSVRRTSNPAPIFAIGPKIIAVIEVEAGNVINCHQS